MATVVGVQMKMEVDIKQETDPDEAKLGCPHPIDYSTKERTEENQSLEPKLELELNLEPEVQLEVKEEENKTKVTTQRKAYLNYFYHCRKYYLFYFYFKEHFNKRIGSACVRVLCREVD